MTKRRLSPTLGVSTKREAKEMKEPFLRINADADDADAEAKNPPIIIEEKFRRFDFSEGAVDLWVDQVGRIWAYHCCFVQTGHTLDMIEDEKILDSRLHKDRMHIARLGRALASLFCPLCGFRWLFAWMPPMSFDSLVFSIEHSRILPNTLWNKSQGIFAATPKSQ